MKKTMIITFIFLILINLASIVKANDEITSVLPVLKKDIRGYKLTPIVVYNKATGNYETIHLTVDSNGNLITTPGENGLLDSNNTSTVVLSSGAVFTGTATDILNYGIFYVNVYSDVASATDGLSVQQSQDGVNWDNTDDFTVPAATGKTYSFQAALPHLRVVYTNGPLEQSEFRLCTVLKKIDGKSSTHRISDIIRNEDDGELVKAVLAADSGDGVTMKNINVQHPLPVDGDQVFEKDVDQARSTSDGWTGGEVIDLVNNNYTVLTDSSATNPKVIYMELKRPIQTNIFGFSTSSGNFSNTKISATIGQGADSTTVVLLDESADNTKKTTIIPEISPVTLLSVTIEFYTVDPCNVSALILSKAQQRIARIQGLRPDGSTADFQATQSGNFKVSVEEFENNISTNNNTQLKVTNYNADGTEGVIISSTSIYNDTVSGAWTTITFPHHEVHEGDHYFYENFTTLASGSSTTFTTISSSESTKQMHMLFLVEGTDQTELYLFEGSTANADGTLITSINNNRNSSNTSVSTIRKDPTGIVHGNQLFATSFGKTDNPVQTIGGGRGREIEIVLKPGIKYTWLIISRSADNIISWLAEWYEHTPN